jgi:hypothetical protein
MMFRNAIVDVNGCALMSPHPIDAVSLTHWVGSDLPIAVGILLPQMVPPQRPEPGGFSTN